MLRDFLLASEIFQTGDPTEIRWQSVRFSSAATAARSQTAGKRGSASATPASPASARRTTAHRAPLEYDAWRCCCAGSARSRSSSKLWLVDSDRTMASSPPPAPEIERNGRNACAGPKPQARPMRLPNGEWIPAVRHRLIEKRSISACLARAGRRGLCRARARIRPVVRRRWPRVCVSQSSCRLHRRGWRRATRRATSEPACRRATANDTPSLRPGASPSQNERVGGWPWHPRRAPCQRFTRRIRIRGIAELEHVAGNAFHGEVFADAADVQPCGSPPRCNRRCRGMVPPLVNGSEFRATPTTQGA